MRELLLFIFTLTVSIALTQPNFSPEKADSLWKVWQNESIPDTSRLKAINAYAWDGYLFTHPDSAFYYANLQFNFSKEKNIIEQMGNALNTQGASFAVRGEYDNAISYYSKALQINKEMGDKKGIAASLNNIGVLYHDQGENAEAIDCHSKALKMRKELGDKNGIAASLNNIGLIFNNQGNYAKAIDYYTRSLKILNEIKDKIAAAGILINIGNINHEQGNYTKAIDYYTKSLKIRKELGDKNGIASSMNNIGGIYHDRAEYNKAIEYFSKSLDIKEELGDTRGIAASLNNIGVVHKIQRDYVKALEYFMRSLQIREEIGDKNGVATSLNNIGDIYFIRGKYTKAFDYSSRSLSIAKDAGAVTEIRAAYSSLWKVNKKLGRHKEALEIYELYITTRDSLESEENQKEVIRQEFKYEYEKQATADSIKSAEAKKVTDAQLTAQEAQLEQEETQRYALYGGLGLLFLFGGFMYNRFRVTSKQKDVIQQQKSEVEVQKQEAEHQREIVEEKNREITDSITYAKRIQSAILPPKKLVLEYLPESFILYKPKDIVAGDFYWMEQVKETILFAAADCTGHGVPGAMVSVVCNNGLNRSVREYGLKDPGKILDKTRDVVISEFQKSEEEVKDGMDISLCVLDLKTQSLHWAGANNPIWIIRDGELLETKPDKQPIGVVDNPQSFTTHKIELKEGDTIYVFTDGFQDQFGGEKGKKFKPANFKKLLLSISSESMGKQREIIDETFEKWKGDLEQLDDVCVIGVKV